jgi:hypothetical protein
LDGVTSLKPYILKPLLRNVCWRRNCRVIEPGQPMMCH